jgi:hypothetical protein
MGEEHPTSGTAGGTATAAPVDHLGILVVYFLKDDHDLPLLELHLDRIERHTHVPYTLYAVANRVTDRARSLVEARPNVRICEVPVTPLRASREHGFYLDAMLPIALADGVSHICTLDVDSFPIDDSWIEVLAAAAPTASGLTGILRVENGDVALPHPSCILARREFFEEYMPSFAPDSDYTPEFRRFLQSTEQAADTGIRLGYALWQHELTWGHLIRTNVRNPHYLLAGIYGEVIFHLGSAGRGKVFRQDFRESTIHRLSAPIERLPMRGRLGTSARRSALRFLRRDVENRVMDDNASMYESLRSALARDPDGLISYLRGEPPTAAPGSEPRG